MKISENDSYIATLIRQDSIEKFITLVNRKNILLSSTIKPSIYETNQFLINKEPTLIEYASFFGSIQVVKYLYLNNIKLTESSWLYVIHSNTPELIHFLEENNVQPEDYSYNEILKESIKCYHNDIANYIKDNLMSKCDNITSVIKHYSNFCFLPDDIKELIQDTNNDDMFKVSDFCFNIKKITIPSSVTSIGCFALAWCESLEKIIIPSSVTSIKSSVFKGCISLIEINIPSSVTSIGSSVFEDCKSLIEIKIPSSVTSVGNSVFKGCSSLSLFDTSHSSMTSIEDCFFLKIVYH